MAKGHKKSDFENLPVCAAQYIKQVIRKMRYRRKVRADVQAELTAHFEDELKGCKTQAEKEQKAEQLIAGFGDAKLLAVLLRRAKKRCRPLWQTVVARTFQAAGIMIVCLILYVFWFYSGKPVITTDYIAELNRIVRPASGETLNAAPLYDKAADIYENLPDNIVQVLRKKHAEATSQDKQLMDKWLTDNEETLELLIAGTQRPYYWRRYRSNASDNSAIGVVMPHLSAYKNLARSLRWRAELRAEQGRYQDAFGNTTSCYRLGQHLRGDKFLIEQLIGIAIEALAVQGLCGILSGHDIDSAALATLQQDFEKMIADEDFVVSLKAEKLFMYDEIQRCFTEDRIGGGHLYLKRFNQLAHMGPTLLELMFEEKHWTVPLHVLFTHPNKQQSREMTDRFWAFCKKMVHKTPAQLRAEGIDIDKQAMEIIKGNILLEILTPALGRINEISYRIQVDVEATVTILAALRYKQNVGNYPEGLNELITSGYLKELPMDAFSGRPLVYKKTDDNFILYGVGLNYTDDGGMIAKVNGRPRRWGTKDEGDWVFWPVPKLQLKK